MQLATKDILNRELETFRYILMETETFFEASDQISLDAVTKLLETREQWIEILRESEKEIIELSIDGMDNQRIRTEISEIARTIVGIDAKILDLLQLKKQKMIKDMISSTDNSSGRRKERANKQVEPRFIDIHQK